MSRGLNLLKDIFQKSKQNPKVVYKEIFSILQNKDLYYIAYQRIRKNLVRQGYKYSLKPQLEDTVINNIIQQVMNGSYAHVSFPISLNKPLPINVILNYVLQEVIYLILEAIYFPILNKEANFTWSRVNPHTVLQYLEQEIPKSNPVIQTKLRWGYFELNNSKVNQLLAIKIQDLKFLNLINNIINEKIFFQNYKYHSLSLMTEVIGSSFPYLIYDLYYNPLDNFINYLSKHLQLTTVLSNQKKNQLKYLWQLTSKKNYLFFNLNQKNLNLEFLIISYIRYGDQVLICINPRANQSQILFVKELMDTILQNNNLNNEISTKYSYHIINIKKNNLYFLGYTISVKKNKVVYEITMQHIIKILVKCKFLRYKTNKSIRPTSNPQLLKKSDFKIVANYVDILYHLSLYYSGVSNWRQLCYLKYLLNYSCAMTLAHKYKSTVNKIFKQYGKHLYVASNHNSYQYVSFDIIKCQKLSIWHKKNIFLDPLIVYSLN